MARKLIFLLFSIFATASFAQGNMWSDATPVSPLADTYRIPIATSSSSGPSYVTPLTVKSYIEAGGTVTASDPVLDLSQTWNDGAVTFTGLLFNVTNTASAAASKVFDFQVGGSSVVNATRGGILLASGGFTINGDANLYRDAAGTIAQRNGTNAQTTRVYNTYTDASNYERADIGWSSNTFVIDVTKAGTGTQRAFSLRYGGSVALGVSTAGVTSIGALNITGSYGLTSSGLVAPLQGFRHVFAATTLTSYTLALTDSGSGYVATSGSDQTFTMPSGVSSGTWYMFKVSASKSSYLRFTANTGQKIRLAAGVSASAGYVRSNTGGSWVYLVYDSIDAEWVAWSQGGTWTIDS